MKNNNKKEKKPLLVFLRENIKTVLFFAVCFAFASILVVGPTVTYIQMQTELNRTQDQLASEQEKQTEFNTELDKWNDKEFVIAKARERLRFIMPGEILFKVTDYDESLSSDYDGGIRNSKDRKATNTWYQNLYDSIRLSDSVDVKTKANK